MKVSSKHTENSSLLTDVELPSLQTGGKVPLLDIREQKTVLPSKQDNTKLKSTLKSKVGPADYSRWQGEINTYDKSPRERLLSTMYKVANTGNGALTGLVASPVISGAKLLRPDKYFKGVNSDSKFGSAVGEMGVDLLNVAPVLPALRKGVGMGRDMGRAVGDAFGDSVERGWYAFKNTSDLPIKKRVDNALLATGVGKERVGDQLDNMYFDMTPDQARYAMSQSRIQSPPGAVIGDYTMSVDSSPLYWMNAAKGGKDWKILRTGMTQEVTDAGYMGRRVGAAFPEEVRPLYNKFVDEAAIADKKVMDQFNSGEISSQTKKNLLRDNHPNQRMFDELKKGKEGFPHLKAWFDNYKATMDKGVKMVNEQSGLNFPLTKIRGAESGNPKKLAYSQPTSLAVKGGHVRTMQTFKSNLQDIPRHYLINRLQPKDGLDEFSFLRNKLKDTYVDEPTWKAHINYLRDKRRGVNSPPINITEGELYNYNRIGELAERDRQIQNGILKPNQPAVPPPPKHDDYIR